MKAVVIPAKPDGSYNTSPHTFARTVIGPFNKIESIERRAREWATVRGHQHWAIEVFNNNTITGKPDQILIKSC